MPLAYDNQHITTDGQRVGYNLAMRGTPRRPPYYVYFKDPGGRRLERNTGESSKPRAAGAARAIIEAEYRPAGAAVEKVTWAEARERLEQRMTAAGLRPRSVAYYLTQYDGIAGFYAATDGPADISPSMAQTFSDQLTTGKGRGGKTRSGWTAATRINAVSVVFGKWLRDGLGVVAVNPFEDVDPPKRDRLEPKVPTAEQVEQFYQWLSERFPDWQLPHLFFRVKERAGCRLLDLCSVRSDQLRDGRLHLAADQTKGRKARSVPLPPDLFDALQELAGPVHLWQRHPAQLKAQLRARGWPTHQLRPTFKPDRFAYWVQTLFHDYHDEHPDRPRITSHQFRKRAFTEAYRAGVPLDAAAVAFGCDVGTIKGHYLGVSEQDIADEVFARLDARRG